MRLRLSHARQCVCHEKQKQRFLRSASASPRTKNISPISFADAKHNVFDYIAWVCVNRAVTKTSICWNLCALFTPSESRAHKWERKRDTCSAKPHVIVVLHRFHFAAIFPFWDFLTVTSLGIFFPVALLYYCSFFVVSSSHGVYVCQTFMTLSNILHSVNVKVERTRYFGA